MTDVTRNGNFVFVTPENKIVAATIEELETKLKGVVEEQGIELIIDFKDVEDIDSIGVGLLVATHNSLSKSGGKLSLINTSAEIYNLLSIMRLNDHFKITKA